MRDQLWLFEVPWTEQPKHSGSFFEAFTTELLGARRNDSENATNGDLFSDELRARIEVKSGRDRIGLSEEQLARYMKESPEQYPRCLYALCFYKPVQKDKPFRLKHLKTEQEMQQFLAEGFYSFYLIDTGLLFQMCLQDKVLVANGWKKGKNVLYLNSQFKRDMKSSSMTEWLLSRISADPRAFFWDFGMCKTMFRGTRIRFSFQFLLRHDFQSIFVPFILHRANEGQFSLDSDFKERISALL